MRVVGIDTSTFAGGIALLDNGQVVAEYSAYVTRRNSESLMGVLDDMLHDLDWKAGDLQGVAVAVGPGSFTGTRIGVTMAKVLGYSLDIPIGQVVTLDAIAANVVFTKSLIYPVLLEEIPGYGLGKHVSACPYQKPSGRSYVSLR